MQHTVRQQLAIIAGINRDSEAQRSLYASKHMMDLIEWDEEWNKITDRLHAGLYPLYVKRNHQATFDNLIDFIRQAPESVTITTEIGEDKKTMVNLRVNAWHPAKLPPNLMKIYISYSTEDRGGDLYITRLSPEDNFPKFVKKEYQVQLFNFFQELRLVKSTNPNI